MQRIFFAWLGATLVLNGLLLLPRGSARDPTPEKVTAAGLHNVFRLSATLYSGNSPEGSTGFASLKKLGIKTILSVDGTQPEVAQARKVGLRYVHIPIGYNGITRPQALLLGRAVQTLPTPIYIHCHHGQHRGPTAAAVAQLCCDEQCRIEDALALLRSAGTDPRYAGLFRTIREFKRPTAEELARVPAHFPETVKPAGVTQAMVAIDHHWDSLKLIRAAGWKPPADHPDLVPAQEALQLVETYQELRRLPEITRRPKEFQRWLADAHSQARELERVLAKEKPTLEKEKAERLYRQLGDTCNQCHARYRDVP